MSLQGQLPKEHVEPVRQDSFSRERSQMSRAGHPLGGVTVAPDGRRARHANDGALVVIGEAEVVVFPGTGYEPVKGLSGGCHAVRPVCMRTALCEEHVGVADSIGLGNF